MSLISAYSLKNTPIFSSIGKSTVTVEVVTVQLGVPAASYCHVGV